MASAQIATEKKEPSIRFSKYVYKSWRLQAGIVVLGLLNTPLGLTAPYLVKIVIDKAYAKANLKVFFVTAFIGGVVFVISALLSSINSYLSARLSRNLQFGLARDLFRHLQYLPMRFFDKHSTGEFIFRVFNDTRSASEFLSKIVPQIVTLVSRLCVLLIIVFYLNWRLAAFATLLVPLTYLHSYLFGNRIRNAMRRQVTKSQHIFKLLQEVFSHIRLVKAQGKEQEAIIQFEQGISQTLNRQLRRSQLMSISDFTGSVLNKALSGLIAFYGGYQVITGAMTLGSLTAVLLYLGQLLGILSSIGNLYQSFLIHSVTLHRIAKIFGIPAFVNDSTDAVEYAIEKGEISFEDVSFFYKEKLYVLKGVNFCIEEGSCVALVGISGSGKTTILSLLLRLYQPETGSIKIDGIDIQKLRLSSLRAQIGIVLQEPWLWNDTVANNIRYGKDNATMDEVIQAAQLAQAHNFIIQLRNGYDTAVGELACEISEGQKQRIALARAFIRQTKILLLDEAMSCLDSETEDEITDAIRRIFPTTTVVIVSHRLSTVKKADLVCYLEDSTRVVTGNHSQLLEQYPLYRRLFASQLK